MEKDQAKVTRAKVTRVGPAVEAIKAHFLGWQCRIRQHAMRSEGGRPTSAMKPDVFLQGFPDDALAQVIVLLVKTPEFEETAELRHIVQRTLDPAERLKSGMQRLSELFYQRAGEFSDTLTAVFNKDSPTAAQLLQHGACDLSFEQFNQSYLLPCKVTDLPKDHAFYQASYWHNAIFNPNLPGDVRVLAFQPDWPHVEAEPDVG